MREPRPGIGGVYLEIAALTDAPQDVPGTSAILVINFDDPILVPHGEEDVAIGSQLQRIAVQPVVGFFGLVKGSADQTSWIRALLAEDCHAVRVEVIERIPSPSHLQIRV